MTDGKGNNMTEHNLRRYWEIYNAYWDIFKKYTAKFEDTNAYWQCLLHEADAVHQTFKPVNKDLSYYLALATVEAVRHEYRKVQ